MTIATIKEQLPDFAKDIRLNLDSLFSNPSESALSEKQFYSVALAIAFSLKNDTIIQAIKEEMGEYITAEIEEGIKIAVTLMAMNNVYYRFIHEVSDKGYGQMPAKLRMNGLRTHAMEHADFELCALAVSAINGCGLCMDTHVKQLEKQGVSKEAIQSAIRLAAVLQASVQVLAIE